MFGTIYDKDLIKIAVNYISDRTIFIEYHTLAIIISRYFCNNFVNISVNDTDKIGKTVGNKQETAIGMDGEPVRA